MSDYDQNKTAVVTGTASGIGLLLVKDLLLDMSRERRYNHETKGRYF